VQHEVADLNRAANVDDDIGLTGRGEDADTRHLPARGTVLGERRGSRAEQRGGKQQTA
jgi:hypothetical protein